MREVIEPYKRKVLNWSPKRSGSIHSLDTAGSLFSKKQDLLSLFIIQFIIKRIVNQ
jgi:hypothetical protein